MNSNYIDREILDDIRSQNDIVQVISECGVLLRPAGKEYKALCPFHDEKTPSFTVSPQKQMFYCFGCNTGGNVISFLQKYEGKSFIEAVEWLAERAGIALPNQDGKAKQISRKRLELQDLNRFAMDYFHRQLLTPQIGGHALAYLKNRGVKDQTIRQFQLGYAARGRQDLIKAATGAGFSLQQLIDAGLIKNEEQGPIDHFRERVIFPILDERGTPVGFGGRTLLEDGLPKYLNSPTTALYDKSKTLYNLYNARPAIQKVGKAILVEGYFDALMPYQAGVQNVVASLGTAFSESHAALLKRFAEETIIVYDGDFAGFQATLRGLHLLLKEGLRVRITLLPSDTDPDQVIRTQGVEAFNRFVDSAINLIEFQLQRAAQQNALRRIDVKTQAVKEIALTLSYLKSQVELNEYIRYAGQELDIDPSLLWKELQRLGVKATRSTGASRETSPRQGGVVMKPREAIEWQLIEALLQSPDLIPLAKEHFHYQDFTHPDFAIIARMLWDTNGFEAPVDIQNLIDTCVDEKMKGIISNAVLQRTIPPNLRARVEGCLKKLNQFLLWDIERTRRSAALTEGHNNMDTLEELVELSNRRRQFAP
jgi:DNA primase